MPLLDVTDVLLDPDFADRFSVRRRAETVDSHGRSVMTATSFNNVVGVVTAMSPSDLDRQADYQTMTRSISVVTKFKLQGAVTGFQPDLVLWRGGAYIVKHVDPYPQFGPGFYQAECGSINLSEPEVQ